MLSHRRFPSSGKKTLLKLIGVLLFVWILRRVDFEALVAELLRTDTRLFAASFGVMIASYAVKVLRWHILSQYAGATVGLAESWKNYNIGIFLGTITPAKVGEFG
ncbi:MAG: lysylphosphatidylglycerol synthase domain-containing protein, partial [Patescibacteria group bacterium]